MLGRWAGGTLFRSLSLGNRTYFRSISKEYTENLFYHSNPHQMMAARKVPGLWHIISGLEDDNGPKLGAKIYGLLRFLLCYTAL
ncbi:hypothetical protein GJ744_006418 [Endocarpon pusillum]|uniref:Uncharacterized protein n=1 Tax=Endocarpon pusillum TaxID=364733 RepID=A0A8H7ABL0_9EURO|nr:hypothetical protein GJ744_006418 [Endocarpon pusillum]